MEIHLPEKPFLTLVFVNAHEILVLISAHRRDKHGRTGGEGVPQLADVPFYAAGKPGVTDGEIGGLDHGVGEQELPLRLLVVERIKPPAEIRQDHGAQELVFHHAGLDRALDAVPVVPVLHQVRKHAGRAVFAEHFGLLRAEGLVVGDVKIGILRTENGKRIFSAEIGGGENDFCISDFHFLTLSSGGRKRSGLLISIHDSPGKDKFRPKKVWKSGRRKIGSLLLFDLLV